MRFTALEVWFLDFWYRYCSFVENLIKKRYLGLWFSGTKLP
jgi:hypothetical protein